MTKSISYIFLLFFSCFNFVQKWVQEQSSYIKIIPSSAIPLVEKASENLLLTGEDIQSYNKKIMEKTEFLYDLDSLFSLSKEKILEYIEQYTLPILPKYNKMDILTSKNTQSILENRNIEGVEDKKILIKGIIVKRSNVRSFPTNISFYDKKGVVGPDRIQETELAINTPVFILHESKDQLWNFVLSPIYAGWVLKENIALATEEDWQFFIKNETFGVITEPFLEIEGEILDMGVKLPFVGIENGYQFLLPTKTEENTLLKKKITLKRSQAHIGYLPYTKKNVLIQAFKYENIPYRWGGKEEGVDCSSFVMNVYKTFGLVFPRNTSSQRISVGQIFDLTGMSKKEKESLLSENVGALLYQPGHVMINLGEINGKFYMIHASSSASKVVIENIFDYRFFSKIDRMVKID